MQINKKSSLGARILSNYLFFTHQGGKNNRRLPLFTKNDIFFQYERKRAVDMEAP